MDDAQKRGSVCNDVYAQRFMDAEALEFYRGFREDRFPAVGNAVRCRIIDDWLREAIARDGKTEIVHVGAGFDTRPYRLVGGRWWEIDEPQVIDYKNARLPVAECRNPLARITIDFSTEPLAAKLAQVPNDGAVIVVMEGVFMYLTEDAIAGTLRQLRERFPRHTLICDLMNKAFFDRFAGSVHAKLAAAGARFTERPERAEAVFLDNGYVETGRSPVIRRCVELNALWTHLHIPSFIARLMYRMRSREADGFAVFRFIARREGTQ
jgi:methyltransferase (TIGR00027 family)